MFSAIGALAAIALIILKYWLAAKSKKDTIEDAAKKDLAQMDEAIAGGDADAISALFDELRPPQEAGSSDPGGSDGSKAAERQL
jgi:hypothetical protein